MIKRKAIVALATAVFIAPLAIADNWPQWRGPDGDGVSRETDLPITWSKESGIEWKCKLPGPGNSTPAIWGDAIFVTCQVDERRMLLRINKKTGQVVWTRQVGDVDSYSAPRFHPDSSIASPSPVTDGRVVVAHFGNGDLAGYDFDGERLWHRNLQRDHGEYTAWFGHSNSPVIFGDLVISVCMQDARREKDPRRPRRLGNPMEVPSPSYLVAHDLLNGKQRWKTMRMPDLPLCQDSCHL